MILDISLNCIARNESLHIEKSIESVVNKVKEIIFIDHYSIDNTKELAVKLSQKNKNIKIIEIDKQNIISYADAREIARINSSYDYCFKFDADFIALDDFVKKVNDALIFLRSNKDYSSAIFSYYNLYYDSYHESARNSFETYLFEKNSFKHIVSKSFGDQMVKTKPGKILITNQHAFFHANNVKPLINILYRCRMSEFLVSVYASTKNYFEWLYFTKYAVFPATKIDLIDNIVDCMKWLICNVNCDKDIRDIDENHKKYFGKIENYLINVNGTTITYLQIEILRYKDTIILLSDPDWIEKTKVCLGIMYDNKELNYF